MTILSRVCARLPLLRQNPRQVNFAFFLTPNYILACFAAQLTFPVVEILRRAAHGNYLGVKTKTKENNLCTVKHAQLSSRRVELLRRATSWKLPPPPFFEKQNGRVFFYMFCPASVSDYLKTSKTQSRSKNAKLLFCCSKECQ